MNAQSYFITGTDTGVGKTLIASSLVHHFAQLGFKSVGMKPIAAGCEWQNGHWQNEDVTQLLQASNINAPIEAVNPYSLPAAIAPHIAAAQVGVTIELSKITQAYTQLATLAEVVIVEGAGGFCVPINTEQTLADLAVMLKLPVILVVGMRLGCLNHALLSAEAIAARGLHLAGWVANTITPDMPAFDENLATLKEMIKAPCLGVVPHQATTSVEETRNYLEAQLQNL